MQQLPGDIAQQNLGEENNGGRMGSSAGGGSGDLKSNVSSFVPSSINDTLSKINNPQARKAFAARHKCAQKTDKTKASYWSCRLPRYAKLLGLKSNFGGYW